MKKRTLIVTVALLFLVTAVAIAQTLFLTVTAPPYSEAGGGAVVSSVSTLYITVSPSAEIPVSQSVVTVYENGQQIWQGSGLALFEYPIATYNNDYRHKYGLVVEENDGLTLTAQLLYD